QFAWRVLDPRAAAGAPSGSSASPTSAPTSPASSDSSSGITSPFGFVYSFSPEFRTLGPHEPILAQLRTLPHNHVAPRGAPAPHFGFVSSFPPEFRPLGPDEQILAQIRPLTNNDVARVGDAALKLSPRTSTEELRLWPLLLAAGLLLVPLDILIRRLG